MDLVILIGNYIKFIKKSFFTLYFFTILSCLLIRLRRLIIIKEELIFLKYHFFCYSWNWRQLPFVKKCKKPIKMLFLNKHMKPRKFTLTHSGISSVFFLLRRPLVPLTDPCPEPTKLPSIEDRDDTLGDTEGEFLEGPRLWVWKVKKNIVILLKPLPVLDYVHYHTGISCRNFFHSTIIPPWRVSWVSREADKLKEL